MCFFIEQIITKFEFHRSSHKIIVKNRMLTKENKPKCFLIALYIHGRERHQQILAGIIKTILTVFRTKGARRFNESNT